MKGKKDITNIPIISINSAPYGNPRTITRHGIESLVKSIQEHGFTTPIILNRSKDTGDLYVIDGHQRIRAMEQMGIMAIPAIIVSVKDHTALKMGLRLNNAGGRNDFDALANHFEPEFLFDMGFEFFEMGIIQDQDTTPDDEPVQPRPKKYRFSIMCDTKAQRNELKAFFGTNQTRTTFDTWEQKQRGKRDENDPFGGFGSGFGSAI